MTDNVQTPDQQANPGQQAQTTPAPTAGENWKDRYDGLVKKVQELVEQGRAKDAELATLRTQIEQLNAQLGLKDAEKLAAVGERDKQIQSLVTETSSAKTELERLKALELKLQVATELGDPGLMKIAQHIPNVTDKEALKTIMQDMSSFAETRVKEREKQLLAGTGMTAGTAPSSPGKPQSSQEWESYYNGMPLGSTERMKALDEYGDWLSAQHK